jgi:hypothetical protein
LHKARQPLEVRGHAGLKSGDEGMWGGDTARPKASVVGRSGASVAKSRREKDVYEMSPHPLVSQLYPRARVAYGAYAIPWAQQLDLGAFVHGHHIDAVALVRPNVKALS